MRSFIRKNWVYLTFFIICIGFMFAEIINHRFWLSDFSVYYKAAERLISGINLYRYPEDLHYIFKYSPTSASYFIPFLIFPLTTAKIVYWVFLSLIIVLGFYLISKLINYYGKGLSEGNTNYIILTGGIVLALHYLRELHLGQVNYLLMVSYVAISFLYQRNYKSWLLSLIWAAGIFIKPFGFILLPYFILKKKFKELYYFAGFLVIFALLPLLFYQSWNLFIGQYKSWIYELNVEMAAKTDIFLPGNHTVFSVVARYLSLSFILYSSASITIYKLILLIGLGISYFWLIKRGKGIQNSSLVEFAILFATIPLLAFTSENAFGYTGLLIFVLLFNFKESNKVIKGLVIMCLLFIGANFSEIVGRNLSQLFDKWSLISIGTIGLIIIAFRLRFKKLA